MDGGTIESQDERAIETRDLTKVYGTLTALDACTVHVNRGEVFGLLGPNGAGKSTLIRLLLGFLHPTQGRARVAGHDCLHESLEVRRHVAYLPGDPRLFRHMNGWKVARFFGEIRGSWSAAAVEAMAERLELDMSRRVASMSTGMRQKLALLVTLLSDAEILILDEPTSNLDPTARREVLQLVREARQSGKTVLFSSHVLNEVEQVCQRVAILRSGKLAYETSMADIQRSHRIHLELARHNGPLDVPPALQNMVRMQSNGNDITLETETDLTPLLRWIASLEPAELRIEPVGLQAVYDRIHPPHVKA